MGKCWKDCKVGDKVLYTKIGSYAITRMTTEIEQINNRCGDNWYEIIIKDGLKFYDVGDKNFAIYCFRGGCSCIEIIDKEVSNANDEGGIQW